MLLLNRKRLLDIGLYSLFFGIFLGGGIYLLNTALIPSRLGILSGLLFIVFYISRKVEIKKFKVDIYTKFIMLLFVFQFFINIIVTIIHSDVDFTKFIQYIVLYSLIFLLIVYAIIDKYRYLKSLYYTSMIFMFILMIVTYWEITTGNHFSFSKTYEMAEIYSYMPTAFYRNQNDMMAIISFIIIFNLLYIKYYNLKSIFIHKLIFSLQYVSAVILSFITEARLATLTLGIFMFINLKLLYKILTFFIISVVILTNQEVYTFSERFFMQFEGNSDLIRLNLILDAFKNISIFGYGIDNSDLLYLSLNDFKLMGIVNPHNYLIEILINSGYIIFLLFFLLSTIFAFILIYHKSFILASTVFFYYFVLMASSSSIFLYPHYIFFVAFLMLGTDKIYKSKSLNYLNK
jgi:hypothetical protein